MIGVVVGHSLRGLVAAGLAQPAAVSRLDTALYLGHLPVFAFATGLLMPRPVDRDGPRRYLARRVTLLVYLFLIWTVIEGSLEVLTSPVKNSPVTWLDVAMVWVPIGPLWFIPALLLATLVVVMLRPWRGGVAGALAVGFAAIVSLALWGWQLPTVGTQGWGLLFFFAAGAWLRHDRLDGLIRRVTSSWLAVGGALMVAVGAAAPFFTRVTAPTVTDPGRTPASILVGLVAAGSLVAGVLALSALAARTPAWFGWLATIGRLSLQIYLVHIMFTAGTRVALLHLGVRSLPVHLALGAVCGILGPLVVERVTRRIAPWLFSPPVWLGGPQPRA